MPVNERIMISLGELNYKWKVNREMHHLAMKTEPRRVLGPLLLLQEEEILTS